MHMNSTGFSCICPRLAAPHTLRSRVSGSIRPLDHHVYERLVPLALAGVNIPRQVSRTVKIPEVRLPADSARNFKQQFEAQQADFDWRRDSTGFEQRASSVLSSTCDPELLQQLASLCTDPLAPSAVLLTGLPVEDDLPATLGEPPIAKVLCIAPLLSVHTIPTCSGYYCLDVLLHAS